MRHCRKMPTTKVGEDPVSTRSCKAIISLMESRRQQIQRHETPSCPPRYNTRTRYPRPLNHTQSSQAPSPFTHAVSFPVHITFITAWRRWGLVAALLWFCYSACKEFYTGAKSDGISIGDGECHWDQEDVKLFSYIHLCSLLTLY